MQPSVLMSFIIYAIFFCALTAAAENPKASYNSNHRNDYGPPMPFAFGYAVKDQYYNDYRHDTTSNGQIRTGSYSTLLPDGRLQTVNYKADDYGYVADVKYQGEAKYDYKPSAYKPTYQTPSYYAKPAYSKS